MPRSFRIVRRRSALCALSASLIVAAVLPSAVGAYTLDTYNGHSTSEYPENITCVSADAVTHINYINNGGSYTHTLAKTWYDEVRNGDHDFYTYGSEAGLDPRGWAWLLWKHSPAVYGFNDYRYTTASMADFAMESGIRATSQPVGAIVFRGVHAVDVVGFSSSVDPWDAPSTLNGFWIVDPYYGGTNVKHVMPDGGYIGWAPNSYLTIATWNADYLLPYHDAQYAANHGGALTYWDGKYAVVLRAANGSPQPSNSVIGAAPGATETYADSLGTAGVNNAISIAPDPAYPAGAIATAVTQGIAKNKLAEDPNSGIRLDSPGVGRHIDVTSLAARFPDYELVEVTNAGAVVAIAMLTKAPDGLHFAGLQPLFAGNRLMANQEVLSAFSSQGTVATSAQAVWAGSDQSMSPFSPLWESTDSTGRHEFLAPDGSVASSFEIATR